MNGEKKPVLLAEEVRSRQVTFDQTFNFMVAAASLQSRSSNPEEALVGERLYCFLCEKREDAKKRVMRP